MKENRLLDRIVDNLNEVSFWNTKNSQIIFKLDRKFWSFKDTYGAEQTVYQLLLIHYEVGILIRERHYLHGIQEESEDTWLILEERAIRTITSIAMFGTDNLVEQTRRIRKRSL